MKITIRQEALKDYVTVCKVIKEAFLNVPYSDHTESYLVERLRKSDAFIPELSLVARIGDKIVGHILFTKIIIKGHDRSLDALAMAPVSVLPNYQRRGIGGQLIQKGHQLALSHGFSSVILIGHEQYYPKFGYQKADDFGIVLPFEAPPENCMAIELIPDALINAKGKVIYPKEFFE